MVSGEPYPRASDSDGSDSSGHANAPPAVRSRSLATSWRAWIVPVGACVGLALVNPVLGESSTEAGSDEFWMFLIMSVVLILISGLMSGLTVGSFGTHTAQCAPCTVPDLNLIVTGYMSLDALTMNVLATAKVPEDATKAAQVQKEKRQAAKVQTVKKHHNLLLVTLVCEQGGAATHRCTSMYVLCLPPCVVRGQVLANSAAAQTLPIFFDRIVPTYVAIILSVTAILFFGEIFPQAVCTGRRFSFIAVCCAAMVCGSRGSLACGGQAIDGWPSQLSSCLSPASSCSSSSSLPGLWPRASITSSARTGCSYSAVPS